MIEELKAKLHDEVEKLQHELNVVLPNEIRKAVELGDLRENSEYKAALERQQFVQARLGLLRQRLSKLSSIDPTQIPGDRVGLGSTVVVRDKKWRGLSLTHTSCPFSKATEILTEPSSSELIRSISSRSSAGMVFVRTRTFSLACGYRGMAPARSASARPVSTTARQSRRPAARPSPVTWPSR